MKVHYHFDDETELLTAVSADAISDQLPQTRMIPGSCIVLDGQMYEITGYTRFDYMIEVKPIDFDENRLSY